MTRRKWLTAEEAAAWRGLLRMQAYLTGELARRLASESSLSYPDYEVLVALTDQPDGRLRLFGLAAQLGWEQSRLSHHVTRMTARGLVRKESCEEDRRGFFVVVTNAGRAELASAAPGHVAAVRELFIDRLTAAQRRTLTKVSTAVLPPIPPDDRT